MPNDDFVEAFMDALNGRVRAECRVIGAEMEADLRKRLAVPVGRVGGVVVVRSAPGEHPRKETGDLQAGSGHDVIEGHGPDRRTLSVYNDDHKSPKLEHGHGRVAPRPHMNPLFDRWLERVTDRLHRAAAGP